MLIQPVLRPVLQPVLRSIFDPGIGGGGTPSLTAQVQALFAKYSAAGGMWDFTNTATLFQDSAGTTPVTASGQMVGYVADLSGHGIELASPATGRHPQFTAGDGIAFDGVDDSLWSNANVDLSAITKATIGVAYRFNSIAASYPQVLKHGVPWPQGDGFGVDTDSANGSIVSVRQNLKLGGVEALAVESPSLSNCVTVIRGDTSASTLSGALHVVHNGVVSAPIRGGLPTGNMLNARVQLGKDIIGWYVGPYTAKRVILIGADLSVDDFNLIEAWLGEAP